MLMQLVILQIQVVKVNNLRLMWHGAYRIAMLSASSLTVKESFLAIFLTNSLSDSNFISSKRIVYPVDSFSRSNITAR
jgi:hypothetical protein